jgi:hypothetical protein
VVTEPVTVFAESIAIRDRSNPTALAPVSVAVKPFVAAGAEPFGIQRRPCMAYGRTARPRRGPPASGTVSTGAVGLASETASTFATPRLSSTGCRPLIQ